MSRTLRMVGIALVAAVAATAQGQSYPDRPIKLIVPYAPGGGTDILARQIAPQLSTRLRQPVVVENRPGAGGNVGALAVAGAAPDGYTLLMGDIALSVNPSLSPDLPNPTKRLDPVALLASAPLVLIVNHSIPAATVDELVKLARSSPDQLAYGAAAGANPTSLAPEVFKNVAGVKIKGIPYKGAGPALTDTVAGHVSMMFAGPSSAKPQIDAGKVRALAVTMKKRLPSLPNVPTFAEAGLPLPDLDDGSWWGVLVPVGTPAPVKAKLEAALKDSMNESALRKSFDEMTIFPNFGDAKVFGDLIQSQTDKWAPIIRAANITAN